MTGPQGPRSGVPADEQGPLSEPLRPAADLYDQAEADIARRDGAAAFEHLTAAINLFDTPVVATRADGFLRARISSRIGNLLDWNSDYAGARFRYLRQAEILADLVSAEDVRLLTARYNVAEIARLTGDLDAALAEFDRLRPLLAAAAAGSDAARHLQVLLNKNRGQALKETGRWAEAEAAYDAALVDSTDPAQRLTLLIGAADARRAQKLPIDIESLDRELDTFAADRDPAARDLLFLEHQIAALYPPDQVDRRLEINHRVLAGLPDEVRGDERRLKAVTLLNIATIHCGLGDREAALTAAQQAAPLIEEIYADDVRAGGTAARPVDPPWPIAALLARVLRMPGPDHPPALRALHRAATGYKRGQAELLLAQHELALTDPERSSIIDEVRAYRSRPDGPTDPDPWGTLAALSASAVPRSTVLEMFERSDVDRVAKALPAGRALVEYVKVPAWKSRDAEAAETSNDSSEDGARFVAFVIRSDEPALQFVDLGSSAAVETATSALLSAIPGAGFGANRQRSPEPPSGREPDPAPDPDLVPEQGEARRLRPVAPPRGDWRIAASDLAALIWAPLADLLPPNDELFLAPDGALCAVPFDALPSAPEGPPLLATRTLSLVGTGRDLVRLSQRTNLWPTAPIVVAAPDFGDPPTPFVPLPGTAIEGAKVGALLQVQPLTGADAQRSTVLAARHAEIVHLASHGYAGGLAPDHRLGPLADCGIALAGANTAGDSGPEGVLTGLDVLSMQLSGTDLVVLSACDTNLGELDDYEGLLGLARSFFLGGARSVVSSLWRVSDSGTAELMHDFYRRLLAERGRAWALADAKRAVYQTHPDQPELWAAFISTGDHGILLRYRWVMIAENQLPPRAVDARTGVAYVDDSHPMGLSEVRIADDGDPVRVMNINMRNSWLEQVDGAYWQAWRAFHEKDYDRTRELVDEVLDWLKDQPVGRLRQADALALGALCFSVQADLDNAAEWGWQAVNAYQKLNAWPIGESVALDNLGITEINRGRTEVGLRLLEQSLQLKQSTLPRDEQQIEFTRNVLSDIHDQL